MRRVCLSPVFAGLCVPLCLVLISGCSKSKFKTAQVSGVCKCNGVPMSAGLLILAPIQEKEQGARDLNIGKPARAIIQPDGSFTMSTYGKNDGAVIGKHRVVLNLAELDEKDPKQPCTRVAKGLTVEVVSGKNQIELDLAKAK